MWFVYIVRCADNTLYAGSTTDINRRIREHNSKNGAAYTRGRLPVKLVYQESLRNRSQAQRREAVIKGMDRKEKLALIRAGL